MSHLIARYSRLGTPTKWFGGLALCLAALLLIVVSAVSDNPPDGGPFGAEFRLLSAPVAQPSGAWRISWTSVSGKTYQLQRTANDDLNSANWVDVATLIATGPVTYYDDSTAARLRFYRVKLVETVTTSYFVGDPDFFVPLSASGQPIEGGQIQVAANGLLAALELRPGGRNPSGNGQGFFLRFPNGARVITNGTLQEIEFTSAVAGFGPDSPLQLAAPLSWSGATPKRVSAGSLDVTAIAQLFDRNPADGLDLLLFGKTPITWLGGVLADDGIRGARFSLKQLQGLPLPGSSGGYSEFSFDFNRKDGLRIPFSGEFTLPDGSGSAPKLLIPSQRPLWLTIKPGGQLALEGRADLTFPGGPGFSVNFGLDDPHYHLKMVANGIHLPLIGSLAALLPNSPAQCIPASPNSNQLNLATACLRSFDNAYLNFSASAVGVAPATNEVASPDAPPQPVALAISVLEAWTHSALASQSLPLANLQELLQQSGDSAVAARDLETICAHHLALLRAKLARQTNAFQGNAAAETALNDAIAKVVAAAIRRADDPDAVVNLGNMAATARCLLEIQNLIQRIGSSLDAPLTDALTRLISRFSTGYTAGLGVTAGVFTPPPASRIAAMDRFEVFQSLKDLAEVRALAQALGVDGQVNSPVPETLGQLALRSWEILGARMLAAEAANDYPAFTYAMEDALDLVRLRQSGILPDHPDLANLPGVSALNSFAMRLGQVFANDSTRLTGQRSLENQAVEIRRLMRLVREMPPAVTFAAPPFQRAYDRMEAALALAVNVLNAQGNVTPLVDLFEAGILHAELRDRFQLAAQGGGFQPAAAGNLETTRLPLVVNRLITVATQKRAWSELHHAAQLALDEAVRRGALGDQPRRLLYLQTAAQLLQAAHDVAVALWNEETTRRHANPALYLADMLLPGDIHVDRVAGSVRYDRYNRLLDGAFSGQLRLPRFDSTFNVQNASMSSGGTFSLTLSGQAPLPPAGHSAGTFTIPDHRPIRISFQSPDRLEIAGGARLELNNGMSFEGHISLADPIYSIGAEAEGLQFDLVNKLTALIPTLPETETFSITNARLLNDYFTSMNAALYEFAGPPPTGFRAASAGVEPGERPDFQPPPIVPATASLQAWAGSLLVDDALNTIRRDYTATMSSVRENFDVLLGNYERRRPTRTLAQDLADARFISRVCAALETQRENPGPVALELQNRAVLLAAHMQQIVINLLNSTAVLSVEEENDVLYLADSIARESKGVCFTRAGFNPYDTLRRINNYLMRTVVQRFHDLGLDYSTGAARDNGSILRELDVSVIRAGTINLQSRYRVVQFLGALDSEDPLDTARFSRAQGEFMLARRNKIVLALRRLNSREDADCAAIRQWTLEYLQLDVDQQLAGFEYPADRLLPNVDGTEGAYNTTTETENIVGRMSVAHTRTVLEFDANRNVYTTVVKLLYPNETAPKEKSVRGHRGMEAITGSKVPDAIKETLRKDPKIKIAPGQLYSSIDSTTSALLDYYAEYRKKIIQPPTALTPQVQQAYRELLSNRLAVARVDLNLPRTSRGVFRGQRLLQEILLVAATADLYQLTPIVENARADVTQLTTKFCEAVLATENWSEMDKYTKLLLDTADTPIGDHPPVLKNTLEQLASKTIRTSAQLAGQLKNRLSSTAGAGAAGGFRASADLPSAFKDLDLPGNVAIQRVFGEVLYDRSTGLLSGTFGGRVEFPDLQNAFFEISNATLDSDLNFSITAATGGPLPFDGVTATASIMATGGRDVPLDFTGDGTLTLEGGPNFAAKVSFNTGTRTLSFDTQAGNLQSWRLTDNLVLFDAGFGFTVRPDAQAGELRANGSAGFFAKGTLPTTNSPLTQTNFHLFADNVRASLAFQPGRVDLTFSNGTLHLPAFFYPTNMAALCPGQGPATGPTIALNPASPIRATFLAGATPSIGFQGELNFRQFGFETPALPGLAAAVCNATLKFSSSELPYLTNVVGSLQIPIPNQTNYVDLTDGVFTLAGYPSGRVQLRKDLTLVDLDGFKFTLLGQGHPECPLGSGLTVFPSGGFNRPPSFKLDGGLRVVAPVDMLTGENGDEAFGLACGSLEVRPGELPALDVQALQFGGTFHLGSGGPVIRNALISLEGFPNLFQLDDAHRFIARVEGRLQIPSGPEFILQDARFTFFDPNRLPKFSVAGIGVNNTNFTLMKYLPAQVTRAEIHFKAPLAEVPGLLVPTNVTVLLSAEIKFPATGTPMLAGAVDQIEVEFDPSGIPRVKNLDGFELGIGVMKLPPIQEIGGRIRIGGLSAGDPRRVYLVGRVGGSYQGYTVIGQFAATLFGPLGYCLDVNAGAAGIPLGPSGILITGASGGVSYVNSNGDPCDFTTYFTRDANGNLVGPSTASLPGLDMTWEAFRDVVERMEAQAQIFADNVPGIGGGGALAAAGANGANPVLTAAGNGSTVGMPCPGDCPPPTVNIFCQPHPDQSLYPGKIIAKFSSIDELMLNRLGITQERIQSLGGSLATIAAEVAHALRTNVANLTPPPDPALLGPQAAAALAGVIASSLDTLEATFSNLCFQALGSPQAGENAYAVIRRLAYEGLPCADVTMTVAGNISYAGISSMAYITGKGIVSTAGSAGVIGTVYVMGVPLGQARVFVAATDEHGDPNPAICGEALVGFGPIDLGTLKLSYSCKDCVTGVLGGIPEMLGALSDPLLQRIASRVQTNSALVALPRAELIAALLSLPVTQQLGIFAELANEPLSSLPVNLPQVFFQGIADLYDSIQPKFVACGEVAPKLFGLSLGSSLVEAKLFATKTEVAGGFGFSPSYLLAAFLPILPGSDSASVSFAYQITNPYAFLFGGLGGNFAPDRIASYTQSAIDSMLQNSTYAVSYEIHPLGLSMGSAAGRAILPDLTSHPVLPWSHWVRPEDRGNPNLPSRHDLLLAALASGKLGDAVNWRGTTNDLFTIYPAGSPQSTALKGLSLSKDYFPHGGVLGAARVTLPAMLTEKPPLDKLGIVLNQQAQPIERLTTAIDLIQNYVLRFNTNGSLGFYVPAPNPPAFYDLSGQLAGQAQLQGIMAASKPQDILESIKSFDIANLRLGNLYPVEQAFLRGYLDGELLGVPILRADVVGLPADAQRSEGFLSITSSIPSSSWLKQFIPQATLIFDARGLPPKPIEERFAGLLAEMQAAKNSNADDATLRQLAETAVLALTGDLPKVRLTADLQAGLQMPPPVSDLLAFSGGAHLHGFSPRYEPAYEPMNDSPFAQVRREGGLAFQGAMRLKAGGVTLVDIANAEMSVVPKASGLPALAARLEAPVLPYELLTFRDVLIDFASDPNPHFTAAGRVDPLAIGDFQLVPGLGSLFNGRLAVARTGPGTASISAQIGPARIVLPSLIAGTDTVLIHGTSSTDPFTFSSTGNWEAKLSVSSQLSLGAGGIDLVRLNSADFQSLRFYGTNGLTDATMEFQLKPNLNVVIFPGQGFQRSVTISPAGALLRISRDGSFELTGTLGGGLALSGLPITSVNAGASIRLTQDGLTLTAQAGQFGGGALGGALGGVPANQASGSITFGRDGTISLNGVVTVSPFSTGQFTVESQQGGANSISARIENSGLILSGARLMYRSAVLAVLPEITVQNNGNFSVVVGAPLPVSVSLEPFSLNNVAFTLQRTGGVLSVPTFAGTLAIPRLNRAAGVTGSLGANGTYTLTGTLQSSVGLSGLPAATLGANASVTLTESSLRVNGGISGGTLSQFSVVGNATASLAITPTTMTLSGLLTVSPLNFGLFTIESSAGGTFPIHLANTAITLSNVQVRAGSLLSAPLALTNFPMQMDGSFTVPMTLVPGAGARNLAGYPCAIASFTLRRVNGVVSMDPIVAALNLSGFNQSLSGSISSDGQVTLDYTGGLTMPGGWPLTSSELHLRNSGLTARGNLAVAGLGTLTLDGAVTNNGGFSISQNVASQNFYGFPALNAGYTLSAPAGQSASLQTGLQLNFAGLTGPRFTGALTTGGTFNLQALDQTLALAGFGMTDVDLTLSKPDAAAAVLNAGGTLNLPGFGTPINNRLTGTINVSGVPNLNWGGTLALGGFNLGSGTLVLNDSGLIAHGTLGVSGLSNPTLTFNGEIQPSGAFSLSQSFGSQSFFGFTAQNVVHTFSATPGSQAAITTRFNVGFGDISSLVFEGSLSTSGAAVLRAGAVNRTLAGYGVRNLSLLFSNAAGFSSATLAAEADLTVPDFSQHVVGRYTTGGGVELDWSGSLSLGGFNAGNGFLRLRNTGLTVGGSFDIRVAGRLLGTVPFQGGVNFSGIYSLVPNGSWNLANFIGASSGNSLFSSLGSGGGGSLTLTRTGITGSDQLNYGSVNLPIPINISSLTSSGISFSGTRSYSDGVRRFADPPPPPAVCGGPVVSCAELGDVYGGVEVSVTLTANNSSGSFSASAGGSFAWWVVVDYIGPFPGCTSRQSCGTDIFGNTLYYTRWCADIRNSFAGIPSDHKAGFGPIGIKSDGKLTINESHGNQNGFDFDLW